MTMPAIKRDRPKAPEYSQNKVAMLPSQKQLSIKLSRVVGFWRFRTREPELSGPSGP